jgi:isopenicillin N synthase-like dioxygenase
MPPAPLAIVDLDPFLRDDRTGRLAAAREFGAALERTGFAVIVGHGVPETLSQATYDAVRAFFAMPLDRKMEAAAPEKVKTRGYLPVGIESVAATLSGETPPDLCEALVFAAPHRAEQPGTRPHLWPCEPASLRDWVLKYCAAMRSLIGHMARLSALALELDEEYFSPWYDDPALALRFVNYPDQPDPPAARQLRYGAHHDYGGLTILRQDAAPGGLQIFVDDSWRDVPIVPDAFVINVGDLMARWTNDRWRSTLHRVVNPDRALTGSTARLSMVAFTGPNETMSIACLPSCCSAERPPRYEPVVAGAYVQAKLARSMELTQQPA